MCVPRARRVRRDVGCARPGSARALRVRPEPGVRRDRKCPGAPGAPGPEVRDTGRVPTTAADDPPSHHRPGGRNLMSCEHLVCAACSGPVEQARCPVCREARARVHHPTTHGIPPVMIVILVTAAAVLLWILGRLAALV